METVTLFFWAREFDNTYNYGMELTMHPDRSVFFANLLMPPGEVLHHWDSRGETISLPLLQPDRLYHFSLHGITAPDQMYTQVVFLNDADQTIDHQEFPDHAGDIKLPDQATNYRVQLMNIHQQGTDFRYGILLPADLAASSSISVTLETGIIWVRTTEVATGQDLVLVANRFAALSIPVDAGQQTVAVFAAPTDAQIEELTKTLQPSLPIRLRVYGSGLNQWADQLRTRLSSRFLFQTNGGQ